MPVEQADIAIVESVLGGNPNDFNNLVRKYQKRLYVVILMVTHDQATAEDLVQEAFLKSFEKLRSFDKARPFYPWLAAIGMRLALNWYGRVRTKHQQEVDDGELNNVSSGNVDLLSGLTEEQRKQELWQHVAALPDREKLAMQMFYQQELRVDEIAEILGVTPGTIKTFLHRGRAHLKNRLTKEQSVT